MTFEEYLASKKINSDLLRAGEPDLWATWKDEFGQMSANSFTSRKLYRINALRRKYLLAVQLPKPTAPQASAPRPVIKPKIN